MEWKNDFFLWSSRLQVSRTSSTLKWSSWSWAMPGLSSRTKDPKPCSERAQWASARCSVPPTGSLRHCALSPHTDTLPLTVHTHTHTTALRERQINHRKKTDLFLFEARTDLFLNYHTLSWVKPVALDFSSFKRGPC